MTEENKQYPKITVGAFIKNQEGKFFLMRSPKWKNKLLIPGGHIEWGEKIAEALKREVLEETNLTIQNFVLIGPREFVLDPNYKDGKKHFISLNYLANLDKNSAEAKVDGREATEYLWLTLEEILERDDVEESVKEKAKELKNGNENRDLKEECAEYKAGWQRALADYQNLQKETEKRRGEWAEYAKQMILGEFIPVYDHLKLAINNEQLTNSEKNSWLEGVKYVKKQFADILKNNGVEEIKTVGEKFDPKFHEAVGEEEGKKSGLVVKEVSGGYKMGERVIKVAKVIVSK